MTLDELNAAPADVTGRALLACCGSARWAAAMVARRPFRDATALARAADEVWWALEGSDWLEAFSHHPRIGERKAMVSGWARDEQAGVSGATANTLRTLERRNHEYERKFGHVFLIFAAGKSADEMLAALEARFDNDPGTELRVAAGEQAKITRLRLEKLLAPTQVEAR